MHIHQVVVEPEAIQSAADALYRARETRVAIEPVSTGFGIAGLEAAYRVAELNVARSVVEGRRIVGKKIGLTSKAVQSQLGVDQPDFGMLLDDMEYLDGDEVSMSRLLQPKVEAEVAFIVGRDLNDDQVSYGSFLSSLEYAVPALEIVDSAIADWRITFVDTVADNASCGLYVLGNQPVSVGRISLDELGMSMSKHGVTVSVGAGSACMGHPLRAAYWLARTMVQRGQGLCAGEVILSGALGPMVSVARGDVIQARIGELGNVACSIG
jgi:2-keto-4-pentenoate hydratase